MHLEPPDVALPSAMARPSSDDQTAMGNGPRVSGVVILLLVAVTGLSLLLRTQYISDISFGFDESCSWKISQFPWGEMIDAISRDAHPPFFYALLKGWGIVVGDDAAFIRGVGVFFGVATILASFWFVKVALLDRESDKNRSKGHDWEFTALLAAGLVATSALEVEMSLQARPYTLGTFLAIVSGCFLLRGLRTEVGTALDWILFTITATLLGLTHYYGLLTVAAELLFAAIVLVEEFWQTGWSFRTKRLLASVGLSAWGIQFAWSFWLQVFRYQLGRANQQLWMSALDWMQFSGTCWRVLTSGQTAAIPGAWASLAVVVWALSVLGLLIWGKRAGRLVGLCVGIPLVASAAYSLAVRNILGVRYLIFAHVFLLVGWALLISQIRSRVARIALAGGVLSLSGYWYWQFSEIREFQAGFPGVRGAVAYLDRVRQPEDPVIVSSPFVHPIVQQYAVNKTGIFAQYNRDHRLDMLGGPPLRASECLQEAKINSLESARVWTVDAAGLFGRMSFVRLPDEYRLATEQRFPERYGYRMDILVRKYVRQRSRRHSESAAETSIPTEN